MKYVALLRGINVGGKRKVDMKLLKALFEKLNCTEIETYLNTGNVLFSSKTSLGKLDDEIPSEIEKTFGFKVKTLILEKSEVQRIAQSIPPHWRNNSDEKTDVAYLFSEIDREEILTELPFKKEYIDILYLPGALIWHVKRENQSKSQLNKIMAKKIYKLMTVRNVNTARRLAL